MHLRNLAFHEFLKLRNLFVLKGKIHAYSGTSVSMKNGKSEPDIIAMFRSTEIGKERIFIISSYPLFYRYFTDFYRYFTYILYIFFIHRNRNCNNHKYIIHNTVFS